MTVKKKKEKINKKKEKSVKNERKRPLVMSSVNSAQGYQLVRKRARDNVRMKIKTKKVKF
jgi:hypothetical protein